MGAPGKMLNTLEKQKKSFEVFNQTTELLSIKDLAETIGKNARKTILDQYSPDVVKEKYLITYKKLLNLA